jgi:hypothetical protein
MDQRRDRSRTMASSSTAKKLKTPLDQRVKDMVDEHLEKEEEETIDHIIDETDDVYLSESDVSDDDGHHDDGHHDDGHHDDGHHDDEIASRESDDDDDDIMLDFETGRVKNKKMLKGTKKKSLHEYEDELEYDAVTPGEERFIRRSA